MSGDDRSCPENDGVVEDDPLAALRAEFADIDESVLQLRDDARRAATERAGE